MCKKRIFIILFVFFVSTIVSGIEFKRRERLSRGHKRAVTSVIFSPNSSMLLSTSFDRTLKTWKSENGSLLRTFNGHGDWVSGAVFSPDGKFIASAGHDRTVRIWRADNAQLERILSGHSHFVSGVVFSSDGKSIYSICPATKTLLKQSVLSGKTLVKWVFDKTGQMDMAVFSPDRSLLAAGIGKFVYLFSTDTGNTVKILNKVSHLAGVKSIAFTPDGKYLITGGGSTIDVIDGSIRIWDINTGNVINQIKAHDSDVFVTVTSDSRYMISASTDRTVKIWNFKTGSLEKTLQSDYEAFWCIAVSPDNRYISAGTSESGIVVIWETSSLGIY